MPKGVSRCYRALWPDTSSKHSLKEPICWSNTTFFRNSVSQGEKVSVRVKILDFFIQKQDAFKLTEVAAGWRLRKDREHPY